MMKNLRFLMGLILSLTVSATLAVPYEVTWQGTALALEDARISSVPFCRVWPGHQRELSQTEMSHFVRFDATGAGVLKVRGKGVGAALKHALPLSETNRVTRAGADEFRLALPGPGSYVFEFDGLPTLHVFADPPLAPTPKPGPGGRLIRFAKGEHHPGVVAPKSGDVVVLDEGAVVYGSLFILNATNVTVTGRGIFDGSKLERADESMRTFRRANALPEIDTESACFAYSVYASENVTISGVTFRDPPFWTLVIRNQCRRTLIDNIHIVGNWRYNSDGVDVCASADTVIRNSFIRTFDDCLIARGPYLKGEFAPVSGMVVTNCNLWADWGVAFKAQVQDFPGSTIEDVVVRDCKFLSLCGTGFFLAVRYGCDLDIIRRMTFEDIEFDFRPQPKFVLQKRDGEKFPYEPAHDFYILHACSYTLGKNLDNQINAPMEDPNYYHFIFEDFVCRRFRVFGEKRNLLVTAKSLVPRHEIRRITLEDMPSHRYERIYESAAQEDAAAAFAEAKPVWAKGRAEECNLSLRFSSNVKLTGGEKRVVVRATGCSVYRLRVNGAFAGYGPARGPKGMDRVDEWDVTRFVRKGANAIEFDVAGYNIPNYYLPDQPAYLRAEVLADGRVLAATGTDAFRAQQLNRVQKMPRYSYQRTFAEVWNVSRPLVGSPLELEVRPEKPLLPRRAAYPTFAVNGNAKRIAGGTLRYDAKAKARDYWALECNVRRYKGYATNECALIPAHEADRYVADPKGKVRTATYDFGLLDTGFVGARAKARGKGRVLITFAEVLTNGKVDPQRDGTGNVVVWNVDGPGDFALESFEPYAFRYAQVIADGDIDVTAPFIRTYKSPSADGVACPTKDAELAKIFEAARETFKQNAVDVFTDCPGRERAGWLCDSYFTARVSKYMTGSLDLEYLFLENFLYGECPDIPKGMFPMCYPADHVNQNFIPNWAMWLVLELGEYARVRGGDPELVKRFEPKVLALVDYLETFENADGLLENLPKWVFVEWSECNSLTKGVNYPSNMTWARVLETVASLYGKPALAAKGAKVREAVVRQSYDGTWFHDQALRGKDGRLVLNPKHTETCQYYAFYFGAATAKTHPKLWKTLVEDFGPQRKEKNAHPDVPFSNAFIGNYLRLELLMNAGLKDAVEANVRGYFLKMANATGTLWEMDAPTASCCHGFASYIAILIDRLGK